MDPVEIATLTAVEDRHWWYAERRRLVRRLVRGLQPGVAVDIGAAGGGNTRVLQDLGWTAVALEYDSGGAQVAAARGLPAMRADARRLPVGDGCLDLLLAFDVLEHIRDDVAVVREAARALRPGGRAIIAVPADPRLWSSHDEAVGHVRRYTRGSLTSALRAGGLTVDRVASWNVLLRPAIALRRRGRHEGSDLDDPPALVNSVLHAVVATERYVPGVSRLPGVSLLAEATRP